MCSYVILPKEMKIDEFINKKFTDTSFKTMCDNLSYKKINFIFCYQESQMNIVHI